MADTQPSHPGSPSSGYFKRDTLVLWDLYVYPFVLQNKSVLLSLEFLNKGIIYLYYNVSILGYILMNTEKYICPYNKNPNQKTVSVTPEITFLPLPSQCSGLSWSKHYSDFYYHI